jgi:hypothetical protein
MSFIARNMLLGLRPSASGYEILPTMNDHGNERRLRDSHRRGLLYIFLASCGAIVTISGFLVFGLESGITFRRSWSVTDPRDFVKFPSLLEATVEMLSEGLSHGHFTSVDLVSVSWFYYSLNGV